MSGHLIGCAGALEHVIVDGKQQKLPTSHKLALIAYADSADDRTHIGFAGYVGVQTWAVCSRSRAAELIADLCSWGLLELHAAARPGRRAEYVVFPGGCCDLHRPEPEDNALDVAELARAAGISVDQAHLMLAAINGSDASDSSPRNGSDAPDPSTPKAPDRGPEAVDNHGSERERVQNESDAPDPSATSNTFPPSPTADAAGVTSTSSTTTAPGQRAGCAAHPGGKLGCRPCGTSPRQLAEAAKRREAEEARAAEQRKLQLQRDQAEARRADPAKAKESLAAARAAAERARLAGQRTEQVTR